MNTQPYPMMTESFASPRINPYDPTIQEAIDLASRLEEAAQRLAAAIPAKREKAAQLERSKKVLANVESAIVFYAQMDAAKGEGPLTGIATSSKAYSLAVDGLLARASIDGGPSGSKNCQDTVNLDSKAYDAACIEYEQAETLYHALKYKAGLLSAILVAQRG